MDDVNPANQMNFDEISGHCKVLSAKLAQLTAGKSAATGAVEDLEDYYERALQLRVMANQTLREELRESRAQTAEVVSRIARTAAWAAAAIASTLAYLYPSAALSFVGATWSYALVAVASATAVRSYIAAGHHKRA